MILFKRDQQLSVEENSNDSLNVKVLKLSDGKIGIVTTLHKHTRKRDIVTISTFTKEELYEILTKYNEVA